MTDTLFAGASPLEGRAIREIMAMAMDAPAAAKSGHPGTAMALAPLGVALFSRVLKHHPENPAWLDRDRFILSCGHASLLQYGLAHCFGYDVTPEDLKAFRQPHSRTPGHPENGVSPTVEVTTGPLGQGIANGVGMAMAERILREQFGPELIDHRTWVIAGDGCLEEGVSHEAASLAGSLQLDRLTVIYDDNHITIDGVTELALRDDTAGRFRSYGWHVIEVGESANNLDVLEQAMLDSVAESSRPTLIIVRSHIGYPSPEMMDKREAHGSPFTADVIQHAKEILNVPVEPFSFAPNLPEELSQSLVSQHFLYKEWVSRYEKAGSKAQALNNQFLHHGSTSILEPAKEFEGETKVATRKAMQRAMDSFAGQVPGLTAGSADLTENTGVVIPHGVQQSKINEGGRQIYYGVREFAMGAVMVGQALHGGIRPIGSTFFVFSDYVRPAIRLAALSHAPCLFVFTHDSIGVGEDGPTHQPIEHLASLRAMPNLHVVRPSDANETLSFVQNNLENSNPPATALVLSRQDVPLLSGPDKEASKTFALQGGYVVRENGSALVTLIGTGSEVSVCLEAADELEIRSIPVRVVALPCWECFESQPENYKQMVLKKELPSVSVEAASTFGWSRYADASIGIDSFGMSAPGGFLFQHFNITAAHVVTTVERILQ